MRDPSLFNWAADIKQGFPFLSCNCIKEAPHHHGAGLRLLIKRFGGKGSVRGNRTKEESDYISPENRGEQNKSYHITGAPSREWAAFFVVREEGRENFCERA